MAEYRAYTIGRDGHIVNATPLICEDDATAIAEARKVLAGHKIEIWNRDRLVIRLDCED